MKIKFIQLASLAIMFCCFLPTITFSQWNWQNPLPQGNRLHDIQFPENNTGYAVGENGTVMKSTDGGITWEEQNTGNVASLTSLSFINAEIGFACGNSGTIIKTTNGGEQWNILSSKTDEDLYALYFINADIGFCTGDWGILLKTVDGGNNWDTTGSQLVRRFRDIKFPSDSIGYLVGGLNENYINICLKTTNQGSTWDTIFLPVQDEIFDMCFINPETGYMAGNYSTVIKTTDGGSSWDIQSESGDYHYYGIDFENENFGYLAGYNSVKLTQDGGQHWNNVEMPLNDNYNFSAVAMNTVTSVFTVGYYSSVYNRKNTTWYNRTEGIYDSFISIDFPDPNTSYICGSSGLLKSTNGGNSFDYLEYDIEHLYIADADFCDVNTGYLLSSGGSIYRTTTGGTSWVKVNTQDRAQWFNKIFMVDANYGFAGGGGVSPGGAHWSILLKTTNGTVWESIPNISGYAIEGIYFLNRDFGFISNNSGNLYKTVDGGSTWETIETGAGSVINDIFFHDENAGFLAGGGYWNDNMILKSTDGGVDWKVVYEAEKPTRWGYLNKVYFYDSEHGYAIGGDGFMLISTNGGDGWELIKPITSNGLNDIFFKDPGNGWTCGYGGTLLKHSDPSYIPHEPGIAHLNLIVSPNPCRENINITFQLSNPDEVIIRLYSLAGQEVQKIETGMQYQKLNNISLSTDLLKPGIYLLKVSTHSNSANKKIVKIN